MAAFTKLSDNEMNYYQFKAKQILLQKKEEKEWQDFCKQVAPDCAACFAEKADIKESKDIGIQTFPKKPILKTDKGPLQAKYKNEEIPEALINIKTRLEKIDLALCKFFDESHENEKVPQKFVHSEKKPFIQKRNHMVHAHVFPSQQNIKTFEEQRKLQIQNSLKSSLQNSTFVVHRKPPTIKPKNSSFFLPHDLEVKRAAARRAYLSSLQTKPKVTFQNKRPISTEKAKISQSKKNVPTRKKILPKKINQKSEEINEETLIEAFVADNAKDENIEGVVEAIFEDLLGEAALDLNRIRHKKREKYFDAHDEIPNKAKMSSIPYNPSTSSPIKCGCSKFATNDNSSIMKLKLFIDPLPKENNLRKEHIQLADKSTSLPTVEDSKATLSKQTVVTSNFQGKHEFPKPTPKFVCDVTNIIKIDPEKAKDIASKRNRFWRYLENTSQVPKGDFNPWILNELLAESILDDCISVIAEELSQVPSGIIHDLYNQEFIQQVQI